MKFEATRPKRKCIKKLISFVLYVKKKDGAHNLHNVKTLKFCEKLREIDTKLRKRTSCVVSCKDPYTCIYNKCLNSVRNMVRSLK